MKAKLVAFLQRLIAKLEAYKAKLKAKLAEEWDTKLK